MLSSAPALAAAARAPGGARARLGVSAAQPPRAPLRVARAAPRAARRVALSVASAAPAPRAAAVAAPARDLVAWNTVGRNARLDALEAQALAALRTAVDSFDRPAFPCALIAGDVVILHLLHRLGVLADGRVKVIFIDTLHLFPETLAFLARCEARFSFKSHTYQAAGCADKAAYDAAHGADLWRKDIDAYDKICKVEPFGRALRELAVDAMINGRRRDHGAERAQLELWEGTPASAKCQPLAYWEFRDCFDYLERHGLEAHPLHAKGYPSIGDAHSTVPVPKEKWFEYAGERSGRFQGLTGADGKPKTECGIHVDGSTRSFERDLWEDGAAVKELTQADVIAGALASGPDTLLVVYAPWCPFCQKMEAEFSRLAAVAAALQPPLRLAKLRGDVCRDYSREQLQVASFPTLLAYPQGGAKAVKHATEERSAEALLAFVNAACGTRRSLPPGK